MRYLAIGMVSGIAIGILVALVAMYGVEMLRGILPGC